jgi:phosphoribosyl 1,2-cyclic phosphate phosphodiesterase
MTTDPDLGNPVSVRATLLGTGTSVGVPIIGCVCPTCRSTDPRDRRLRCSCLVETGGLSILIDTSPDFREQALHHGITRIDAVLYTHHHFDHIAGIDDLRPYLFVNHRPIPCFAHPVTTAVFRSKYEYIFGGAPHPSAPGLNLQQVDGPFRIHGRYDDAAGSVEVIPLAAKHGELDIFGYRIGPFAYLTDVSTLPEEAIPALEGVKVLILNALRFKPHVSHLSVPQAVALARRIGAPHTALIHMTHNVLHARDDAALPAGIQFGYDGLRFEMDSPPS